MTERGTQRPHVMDEAHGAEQMRGYLNQQAVIVLVLWVVQIGAALLVENSRPLSRFLISIEVHDWASFALLMIVLLSIVAFALNASMDVRRGSRAWRNFWISVPASIAIANAAYWTMVVPAFIVLSELGLVGA